MIRLLAAVVLLLLLSGCIPTHQPRAEWGSTPIHKPAFNFPVVHP